MTSLISIAICDDSTIELDMIETYLNDYPYSKINVIAFSSGERLIHNITKHGERYPIYILDIEMPKLNGIEAAQKIREHDEESIIIYLTSYSQYMPDVFKVHTFDYLLKPIDKDALFQTIYRAEHLLNCTKTYFQCLSDRAQIVINTEDIYYFEKKARSAFIYTKEGTYHCNQTVSQIMSQLDRTTFTQTHAGFIVNMRYVASIKGDAITLKKAPPGNEMKSEIPLSRKFKKDFKAKFLNLTKKMFV